MHNTEKYKGYTFRINWTSSEPLNPTQDAAEIRIKTSDGQEFTLDFVAKGFLDYVFEKNKETGECAGGAYFCMPRMIVVRELSEKDIKSTLDELIANAEIEIYAKKLD